MARVEKSFTDDEYIVTYTIESDHHEWRLDRFLLTHFTTFSREWVKGKIKRGEIILETRDGTPRPSTKLKENDRVTIITHRHDAEDEYWDGEKLTLLEPEILFEDQEIIVISKPPFMSAHPTGRHLFNTCTVYFEKYCGHTIRTVHRLDRETSGLLMLGKNPVSTNELRAEFEEERVKKVYFLIAKCPQPPTTQFPFSAHERLSVEGKGPLKILIEAFDEKSKKGRRAQTNFELLAQEGRYLAALAFPRTGRQHQIRVHAAVHGFPLLGDKLYNGGVELFGRFKDLIDTPEDRQWVEIPRQALHALAINITYKTQKRTFSSPIPQDLGNWITANTSFNLNDLQKKIDQLLEHYFSTQVRK